METDFIGKYEIISTLGRGSMGVVYKGKDPEIGRLVAIKTLKSVYMGDDSAGNEALQRFRQESRSAGRLHHPSIVTIFEAGRTESGSPYIVMEYIEGQSIESMIAEHGSVPPLAVIHYLSQIASAIDYAHSQNVIHRDIKPSNILIDRDYRAHLLDFGVAKLSDTSLTPAGSVVGTPSYMSPEQIRGIVLDGRTDLFSLAVVAFEALTGVRPFPGNDFTTVVSNIIHKEPLGFGQLATALPSALEQVLRTGLSKERSERYPSALEFVDALARVFDVVVDGTGIVGGYSLKLDEELEKNGWRAPEKKNGKPAESSEELPPVELTPPPRRSGTRGEGTKIHEPQPPAVIRSGQWKKQLILYPLLFTVIVALGLSGLGLKLKMRGSNAGKGAKPADGVEAVQLPLDEAVPNVTSSTQAPTPAPSGYTAPNAALFQTTTAELQTLLSQEGVDQEVLRTLIAQAADRGAVELIPVLMNLLDHPSFVVRVSVIKAISRPVYLADRRVFTGLAAKLNDDESLVRGFAAKALADTGGKAAQEALQARLDKETSEVVQKVLRQCLERFDK